MRNMFRLEFLTLTKLGPPDQITANTRTIWLQDGTYLINTSVYLSMRNMFRLEFLTSINICLKSETPV